MFKKFWISLTLGFCLAGGATADQPADSPEAPADATAAMCMAANPTAKPHETSEPGFTIQAFCLADCTAGPDVSCSGSTCSAVDQSCPNTRGYVQCDGVTTYCAACGPICTCEQGAECFDDSDCDCNQGFGFCDKPGEFVGVCSCYV